MTTDPISDFLTRIRNGQMARHRSVDVPASKLKIELARILVEHGMLTSYQVIPDSKQGVIRLVLKYVEGKPSIEKLERVSRPGIRQFVGADKLPRVRNGLGIAIVSTSQGLMTAAEARRRNVGGEVLCRLW
jgi:small subunit ribosomal protein S8